MSKNKLRPRFPVFPIRRLRKAHGIICVSKLGDEEMDFVQLTTEGSNLQPDWHDGD